MTRIVLLHWSSAILYMSLFKPSHLQYCTWVSSNRIIYNTTNWVSSNRIICNTANEYFQTESSTIMHMSLFSTSISAWSCSRVANLLGKIFGKKNCWENAHKLKQSKIFNARNFIKEKHQKRCNANLKLKCEDQKVNLLKDLDILQALNPNFYCHSEKNVYETFFGF